MRCLLIASIALLASMAGMPITPPHSLSGATPSMRVVHPSRFDVGPPLHAIEASLARTPTNQVDGPMQKHPRQGPLNDQRPYLDSAGIRSTAAEPRGATNIATNFDGLDRGDGPAVAPPSSDIDVSDQHIVQVVNLALAIYSKSGNLVLGPVANDFMFTGFGGDCEDTNTGYPRVLYDQDADRWLVGKVAWDGGTSAAYCVAVSRTSDPTGSWYRYRFAVSSFSINDWAMIGVGQDAYFSAYNMFSGSYLGATAAAFERDALISGDPSAQLVLFGPDPSRYSLMPMDIDGDFPAANVPGYFAEIPFSSTNVIRVYRMNVDWSTPANSTFSQVADLSPATFDFDICIAAQEECIPQPNGQSLTAISDRIMPRLQFREFAGHYSMVFNHTVDADGAGRAGVRWYELRDQGKNGTWTLYQQGTHAPADGLSRWMGSIAMDAEGNIALGYTASSSTQAPSIRYTARRSTTPLGQMSYPEEVIASGVSQSGTGRWGDHSTMATDENSFWFTHEYGSSAFSSFNWATRIAQIILNEPPNPVDDFYIIDIDQTLNADVSANDSDPDGDPLTFSLASSPSDGALTFTSDGTFSYGPNTAFQGDDSFTYSASDGTISRQATVRIRVVDLVFADGFESQGVIAP